MKTYFEKATTQAIRDAQKRFPEEACGLVVDGEYVACENRAEDPKTDFRIGSEVYLKYATKQGVQGVIHSHNDYPHASKKDMIGQLSSGVPWGVVNLKNGSVCEVFWWGDQLPVQDLLERPFIHGVYDCYALVRDYYRSVQSIALKEHPREFEWWEHGENLLLDGFAETGFVSISKTELREGDVIFFQIASDIPNHAAIYLGDGLMLHHLCRRLSRREPAGQWIEKYGTHFLRKRDEKCMSAWGLGREIRR